MKPRNVSERAKKGTVTSPSGFTLLEVMIALAILATAIFILLGERLDAVRQAGTIRDYRTAWLLASRKMADLALNPALFVDDPTHAVKHEEGKFDDYASEDDNTHEYDNFSYAYDIVEEDYTVVNSAFPLEQPSNPKMWQIFQVTLKIFFTSDKTDDAAMTLVAYFPVAPAGSTPNAPPH